MMAQHDLVIRFPARLGEWLRVWALAAPAVVVAWVVAGPTIAAVAAVVAPVGIIVALAFLDSSRSKKDAGAEDAPFLPHRDAAVAALTSAMATGASEGTTCAAIVVAMDDHDRHLTHLGLSGAETLRAMIADRIRAALRTGDRIARIDAARFAVILAPSRRIDLEAMIQLAGRISGSIASPYSMNATTTHATASIGFCLPGRASGQGAEALLSSAEIAAAEALRNGPGAIRAFSPEIAQAVAEPADLVPAIASALDQGQIVAYFQPQLSTHTGQVTGFEVLARWRHPARGVVPPAEFLPAIAAAGESARFFEQMLSQGLSALRGWDRAGLSVPSIAVNVAREDLSDPTFADRLRWELERYDIKPDRLVLEILESVVSTAEADVIQRNIGAAARLGCRIDLDDFGTGQASIANIRRFSVQRIKIDRSFVTRIDTDDGQRQMFTAILSLAERLGIETLAEGVETIGEHALLAQLGCDHVQGFAIARPMPLADCAEWLALHRGKLAATPGIVRRAS